MGDEFRLGEWGFVYKDRPYVFLAEGKVYRYVANCQGETTPSDTPLDPGQHTFDLTRDDGELIRLILDVSCDDAPSNPGDPGGGTTPKPAPTPAPAPAPAPAVEPMYLEAPEPAVASDAVIADFE